MEPEISIVVPVFNNEKYIERCIRSICNQTYTNIEIVIVNDGSTDSTRKICEQMSSEDSRIRLLNIENGGVSNARNQGIEFSTGNYLMFVDADDYIEKDMCEFLLKIMNERHVDVVVSERIIEDMLGNLVHGANVKKARVVCFDEKFSFVASDICCVVTGILYRSSVLEGIRFDSHFFVAEDSLFFYMVLHKCKKYFITDKLFYHYVTYPESASHGMIDQKKYTEILAWNEIKKIVPKSNEVQYATLCAAIEYRARLLFRKSYNSKLCKAEIDELLRIVVENGKMGKKYLAPKGIIERILIWIFRGTYPRIANWAFKRKCQ